MRKKGIYEGHPHMEAYKEVEAMAHNTEMAVIPLTTAALATMVESTVSRSSVEFTAFRIVMPRAGASLIKSGERA
jgi:hypothetical protein